MEETEAESLLEGKVVKKYPSLGSPNLIYLKFGSTCSAGLAEQHILLKSILSAAEQDLFALREAAAVSASGIEYIQWQAQQCQRVYIDTISPSEAG